MQKDFVVYVLSNESRQLYVGVTSNLARRLGKHSERQGCDREGKTDKGTSA